LLWLCLVCGCGDTVREDRTITFSQDGEAAGFQHGEEGVFIADVETGTLEKIYQPNEKTLASSTPLWSPDKQHLIFTTAVDLDPQESAIGMATADQWDAAPRGRRFQQRPARYTCWLRKPSNDDQQSKPVALFEASCDHVGYIAANLAVRWHPDGQRVCYINRTEDGLHGIFEFDLRSKKSKQIFPQTSEGILFDWSPEGESLTCVLGSRERRNSKDGIWIGRPQDANWWHVPNSAGPVGLAEGDLLENLRAARPTWSKNDRQFAFTTLTLRENEGRSARYAIRIGHLANRNVRNLIEDEARFSDLQWTPDNQRIAVLHHDDFSSLCILDLLGNLSEPLNSRPIRRFAGWDATGAWLSYVVPESVPLLEENEHWALLFAPQKFARDAVIIAPGDGSGVGKEIFSGMRVTFPHWSPTEQKLSLWCTFSPTFRSWLSNMLQWGLRPGDPAAILDVQTGEVTWMTVNPHEKVQVGHYHLLKKNYEAAQQWYNEATEELPPPTPPAAGEIFDSFVGPRSFSFFHYYCLEKLGQPKLAAVKRAEFEQTFLPHWPSDAEDAPGNAQNQFLHTLLDPDSLWSRVLRNLYITEVFLSIDAATDGERYFQDKLESTSSASAKLADAVMYSQLLLLQQKRVEYAHFATDTVAPLLMSELNFEQFGEANSGDEWERLLSHVLVMSILPLFAPEFVDGLPQDIVDELLPKWEELHKQARYDADRFGCDLFLHEAYRRQGNEGQQGVVKGRIAENPARKKLLPAGGVAEFISESRKSIQSMQPSL